MKSIGRDDLSRLSLPGGAHVVAVIAGSEQCQLHEHFRGMDCVQLGDLRGFAHSHRKEEPVLVHCTPEVDCHLATGMLEYAGFERVYRYQGGLQELRPYGREGPSLEEEEARKAEMPPEERGFAHLPPWVSYTETRRLTEELPGYSEPFAGSEVDRLRDPNALRWTTASEEIDPFFIELSETAFQEELARQRLRTQPGRYEKLLSEAEAAGPEERQPS